jgi:spore germination cell wall hydrolase CwlJ-like protein
LIRPDPALPPEAQSDGVLLALTVLGEAENQSYQGKCAVAQVVRNRMDVKGKSVADTVLAKWQFSCWDPGTNRRDFLLDVIKKQAGNVLPGVWEECVQAAEGALGSPREVDPTGGSTHYTTADLWATVAVRKQKQWFSKTNVEKGVTEFLIQIGAHCFGRTKF